MNDAEGKGFPVSYSTASDLTVRRLQPEIAAEIEGADLCSPVPPDVARDIRQALLDHGVIFFRDQPVSYEDHLALARVFGEPFSEGILPDKPEVMPLKSNAEQTNPAGGHWHSDGTYYEVAPSVSILRAITAAPLGGDTLFSSAVAAYRELPGEVKAKIVTLRARSSMSHIRKVKNLGDVEADYPGGGEASSPAAEHPVVRVHPETGKPWLYVNEVHTMEIVGLPDADGAELLRYLCDRFRRPEYQMRWSWRDNDIAVWDNRQVQHYAVRNEAGPRYVERIMVAGTPSIGLSDEHESVAVVAG